MGNDGGSIPTRRELVKEGAKSLTTTQVKEVQTEQQAHFWATCALSHEPLVQPVVSDGLGTLYNKAAVLSHLLDLSKQNVSKEEFALQGNSFKDRIRSLKDVVEVHFEEAQRTKTESNKWICPVTQKVLGPGTKAVYLVPCGHAFAESVVKEMRGDVCLQCNEHYTSESIIPILPLSQSEKDRLEARLRSLKDEGITHSLKKASTSSKKRKKVGPADTHAEVTDSRGPDEAPEAASDAIRNSDTASLTSRVLAEQEDKNKRRKANANDNVKSLFTSSSDMLVAKYFTSQDAFTCVANPSVKLSIAQVNDDFCDCPDGSDEPGTSACAHLSQLSPSSFGSIPAAALNLTNALPGFYCKNKGHNPSYIPFMRVNDGICDYDYCCDGSDEWAKVGGIKCEDRCKEIGKAWRKQDEERQRSKSAATKRRKELALEAARLRKEVEDRIETLHTQIAGDEIKVKALETNVAEVERQERGKVVKKPSQGGKLGVLVQLAKDRIGELRASLVELRLQRDVAKARISELEDILTKFKEEYNPNFNDEGVKRAVRSWEDYAARDKADLGNEARNRDLDELVKPESESGVINWSDWDQPEESDVDVLYQFEEYLPSFVRDWLDTKLRNLRVLLIENGILAPSRDSDESKELESARSGLKAAQDVLEGNKKQLQEHVDDLAKDYGADSVFRAMKDHCVERDSGEYTYELCWLGKTTQKSKKGGGQTNMGNFVSFGTTTVDDEIQADGKGVGSGEKLTMKYENGQHCWNGPSRSTLVVLGCAEKDELWKIVEEEKCVYRMEAGTPAVCGVEVQPQQGEGQIKDEL